MQRTLIADVLASEAPLPEITVCGFVRTRRDAREISFLEINDGSCLGSLQCTVQPGSAAFETLEGVNTGAAVRLVGALIPSPGKGQRWELRCSEAETLGLADAASYPLQKKRHSDEFLRGIAHLRARTNKYGAAFRIRSEAAFAIHSFFRQRHFAWVATPLLTGSDCEGAGEMFRVSAPGGRDFFDRPCSLTVSGQLEAEALAMGLGRVYAFGPTFRAENSNTARHAAEFWMVEPEMAFADLGDLMDLAENLTREVTAQVLRDCPDELALFDRFVDPGLLRRLEDIVARPFPRIPYAEAIALLRNARADFTYPVSMGMDLQTEHERWLAEEHFGSPVIVYDYPAAIKAFYMRANADGETVAAMDLLAPRIGELIGGSQREERLDLLERRIAAMGARPEDYWWYLDLRRYGSVPHAGFGLGFERLIMLLTGISNIRDVIPFPRTPGALEF